MKKENLNVNNNVNENAKNSQVDNELQKAYESAIKRDAAKAREIYEAGAAGAFDTAKCVDLLNAIQKAESDNESNAKPRALKNLANDESRLEMFSKPAALRAVKTAFDIADGSTRKYVLSLGFSANSFKQLNADELNINSKSGIKFCTWEVLNACKRYAEEHDLTGEKAKKVAAAEERKKAAEARERIRQQKIVTTRERIGENWCKCLNTFGGLVGFQLLDVNGAPVGKVWSESEYKVKKANTKK